jgi:hypothetical protein
MPRQPAQPAKSSKSKAIEAFESATSEVLRIATGGRVTKQVQSVPVTFYQEAIMVCFGKTRVDIGIWWPPSPYSKLPILCVRFLTAECCDAAGVLAAASRDPQVHAAMIEVTALGLTALTGRGDAFIRANPDKFEFALLIGSQTDREATPTMDHTYAEACFLIMMKGTSGNAGLPDSGLPDSGLPDSGLPDSGLPDSGLPDSGLAAVSEALLWIASTIKEEFGLLVAEAEPLLR